MDDRPLSYHPAKSERVSSITDNTFGDNTQIHQGDTINLISSTLLPNAKDAAFGSFAEQHGAQCLPGTRTDLLREIKEWADAPGAECIFWLNGMAGTGKSTISRTAAQLFKDQGTLGASFFFKRGEGDRGHARLLFATIASQLAVWNPAVGNLVAEAVKSNPGLETRGLQEQFEQLVIQPLSNIQEPERPIVIVIDALDECDRDDDIALIIHMLPRVKLLSSVRLRILITSRPELPIRLGFKKITGKYQDIALHEVPRSIIEHDIFIFLKSEFARIQAEYCEELAIPAEWPGEEIIQVLTNMAVPLFIFASTICRFVADQAWSDPVDQLGRVLEYRSDANNSGLHKLDATYLPILNRLINGKEGVERNSLVAEFRNVIGPIILLAAPLSISSLANLLNIRPAMVSRRLRALHSIFNVPSQPERPIRMFHLSFRDFLVDPARRHDFHVDEVECHRNLAERCIQILHKNLKRDICDLRDPGVICTEVNPELIGSSLPEHIQYACLYWVHHVEHSKGGIDGERVYELLKHHLLHWLEALCFLMKIKQSIEMIDTLQSIVEPGTPVEIFLSDARRFTNNCVSTIAKFPLQIYSSAMIFCPGNSVACNTLINQMPPWTSAFPKFDSKWNTPLIQTLDGHTGRVNSLSWSHDSVRLATASMDETARIWDPVTGQCVLTLLGHTRAVEFLAWSHDSKWLATAAADRIAKVWDPVNGECVATLLGHDRPVVFLAWSHDSARLATGAMDSTARVWDPASGRCISTLSVGYTRVTFLAWSHDSAWLATASDDTFVRLWNPRTGQCMLRLTGHHTMHIVVWSNDSTWLATASKWTRIQVSPLDGGRLDSQSTSIDIDGCRWILSIDLARDTNRLICAYMDGTIQTWDPMTNDLISSVETKKFLGILAWSHDVSQFASESHSAIDVYDTVTGRRISTLNGHSERIIALSWSHNSRWLASASADSTIKIWEPRNGPSPSSREHSDVKVRSVSFSYNGVYAATISTEYVIKIWQTATGQCVSTLTTRSSYVVWSRHSFQIAVLLRDGAMAVWDAETGRPLSASQRHFGRISCISWAYTSDGLASGADDFHIRIWSPTSAKCIKTLLGHTGRICCIAWSQDSSQLLSTSEDGTVRVWNTETGQCLKQLENPNGKVSAMAWSNAHTQLALATPCFTINILRLTSSRDVMKLGGHGTYIESMAWSKNDTRLASASQDGILKIWDLTIGQCMSTLRTSPHTARSYDGPLDLQFDQSSLYQLHTQFGTLDVQTIAEDPEDLGFSLRQVSYGFSIDYTWLTHKGRKLLWLPFEYRPYVSAFFGTVAVIGCRTGGIIFLNLTEQDPLP